MASLHTSRWLVLTLSTALVPSSLAGCGSSEDEAPGAVMDNVAPSMLANPSGPAPSGAGIANMTAAEPGSSGSEGTETVGEGPPVASETPMDVMLDTPGETPANEGSGEEEVTPPDAPCSASATLEAGETTLTIDVDGVERSFLVHAPPSYDGTTRMPVVLDFHGLTGNSNGQRNLTGFDDVADAEGFIAIYPQGLPNGNGQNAWNAGNCCGSTSDDVGFVRAIISTLQAEACIDARRVYASGCSNGGGMSYRLACEAADVIAAVAPVDFDCVVGGSCGNCSPARPITTVQFRGTNDQLVPYNGNGGGFVGAQQNFAIWGELNACTGDAAALQQSADGCESLPMCGAGAETVLCTVQNGTHCGSYNSFDIAQVAWNILQNHALP
jgi:polyhydroxybutyrate depolymerase